MLARLSSPEATPDLVRSDGPPGLPCSTKSHPQTPITTNMDLSVIWTAPDYQRTSTQVRKNGTVKWLRPDGKTQVTVEYQKEGGAVIPLRVHTILISTQHDEDVTNDQIHKDLIEHVIKPVRSLKVSWILERYTWTRESPCFRAPAVVFAGGAPASEVWRSCAVQQSLPPRMMRGTRQMSRWRSCAKP